MVCDTVKPSLRAASCCSVDVVKGGAGERRMGFLATDATRKVAPLQASRKASTSAWVLNRLSSSAFTSDSVPSGDVSPKVAVTR